jgi:hypothetical protein
VAGSDVGRATGLFVVPEIVSFDDAEGEIVFQRLPLIGLRQALSQSTRRLELVGRAASALAAIHTHLGPAGQPATVIETGEVGPARVSVPLHGDFGMRNVFCLAESDDIAVIDWSNAEWIAIDGDFGAPEIDVTVFLMSLFHRRLFGPWPIPSRHAVARHFLATYASASPHGLDTEVLRALIAATTPGFARLTRERKGQLHALVCRHAMLDLNFFLRRLSHSG